MSWTIGEAAKHSGCPASTIRYYERVGLLEPPPRGDNGYRYYDDDALERLAFVHRGRALGFSIDAVADLLRLADHPRQPCDGVDRLVSEQLSAIRARITRLRRLEQELTALQATCDGEHEMRECGILKALSHHD